MKLYHLFGNNEVSEPKLLGPLPLMVGVVEVEHDDTWSSYPVVLVGDRIVLVGDRIDPYGGSSVLDEAMRSIADKIEELVNPDA